MKEREREERNERKGKERKIHSRHHLIDSRREIIDM